MTDVNSLYGLAFDCPYFDRQDDCPLKEMEQLSLTISDEYGGPYQWNGGSELVKDPSPESGLSALYNLHVQADSWKKTSGYYTYAQLSGFVKRNSRLIASTEAGENLFNAAFKNPDGTVVLVVANNADTIRQFAIEINGLQTTVMLPAKSAGTYVIN